MRFILLSGIFVLTSVAHGAGRPPPQDQNLSGKRVIEVEHLRNIRIELPDNTYRDFGEEYYNRIVTLLQQSGEFIPIEKKEIGIDSDSTDPIWNSNPLPSAEVRFTLESLTFMTGSRGSRMFYGFDSRIPLLKNEFPLRQKGHKNNWFFDSFDPKGQSPFDSRAGLDLSEGFKVDALAAWFSTKYAHYESEMQMRLHISSSITGREEFRVIRATGKGYYYEVEGMYESYTGGFTFARKAAMLEALDHLVDSSYSALSRALSHLPLVARVDHIEDSILYLATGYEADVATGIRYRSIDRPDIVIQVTRSVASGALARVIQGNIHEVQAGMKFVQMTSEDHTGKAPYLLSSDLPSAHEEITLPWRRVGQSPESIPPISRARELLETLTLPYRIWRYYQYDQPYKIKESKGQSLSAGIPVAILDSGVDYNHPMINGRIWTNPNPSLDSRGYRDQFGWDYVSNDPRPYDDHYHGTQVTSTVLAIAPSARILPLKVFNPWGITQSAHLLQAFKYAVDHGARIILCGWATPVYSKAIEQGIKYAADHGVIVVASAGDRGINIDHYPVYPASFSNSYENVVAVAGVDHRGHLLSQPFHHSNYGEKTIAFATLGSQLQVAEPREKYAIATSTDLAAAHAAGYIARKLHESAMNTHELLRKLEQEARSHPYLFGKIKGGRVLRFK